jgi:protein-tyrosine-phosphatase
MPLILFVCTANRFRSPLAALYFAREIVRLGDDQDIRVASAGSWAMRGQPAMPKAVDLGKQYGLDLRYHKSQVITEEILSEATLVLVMEAGHKEGILHEFPAYAGRVFLLTEAVGEPPSDIQDPYGQKQAPAGEVAKEIVQLIDEGYDQIVALARTLANGGR